MSSAPGAPSDLRGAQRPRIEWVPPYSSTSGKEAVELAALAGLGLDPWQAHVLTQSLGETADGRWAAFEVGLCVARQNGKGGLGEARALAGLFLLGERFIIWSAHQFDTSLEAFRRLLQLIEETPDFDCRVKRVSRSHGEEGIELLGGQRIRFRTRTKGGGRGFSGDCLILDEAMILAEASHAALLPTLSARPNPQVIYMGSAVDQWVHEHGLVFARVRERGLKGDDPALAYFEWSAEADNPESVGEMALDPHVWAQANPGLGIRISAEHIEREQRSMDARVFAVERLGVGDWPDPSGVSSAVLDPALWARLTDAESSFDDRPHFAFDVTPDRSFGSIGVAGRRPDGKAHVEKIERRNGTGWMPEMIAALVAKHKAPPPVCDGASPAAALIPQLEKLGIEVTVVSAKEHAQACGGFYDACEQDGLRHRVDDDLDAAVKGARKRELGDSWAWSRKHSGIDISSLVAVTLAHGDLQQAEAQRPSEPLVAWS